MKNSPDMWNLTDLFKSDTDPAIEKTRTLITKKTAAFTKKWRASTDYVKKPAVLAQALGEFEELMKNDLFGGPEAYYFSLRAAQDQANNTIKAKAQLVDEFTKLQINEIRFFELNISKIPVEEQSKFLNHKALQQYKHYLERSFAEAKYLLSEREEMIMSMKSSTSYGNWVDMVETFLSKEEREVYNAEGKKSLENFSSIATLMSNKKKKIRDTAAKAFNEILAKHSDVAEAEINSVINHKKTDDMIRNIPRPDITRHIADDMDTEVVDLILKTVSSRFDISKRYYKLKAKLLGLPKLAYHERNIEYGQVDKKYSWKEAVEICERVFTNLDPKFGEVFRKFLNEGRFDVFPRKGKTSGAFCAHYLISQPTYILLNHTGTLRDVLTLAHEVGHGINNELIREKQSAIYFGTPTSTAEVASTFMEDFVLKELMKEADDELKLTLGVMKLDEEISTIPRQIAVYLFEQELHTMIREKGFLSKEEIGKLFQKHMASYMGPGVEQSAGSENWWIYWSHIRSYFYVYTYAGGLLISKSLQAQVQKNPDNIEKVKTFLSAGLSDSPKQLFAEMGIHIEKKKFWEDGLLELDAQVSEMEQLAKKLKRL